MERLKNLWRRLTGKPKYNYWIDLRTGYDHDRELYKIVFSIEGQNNKVYFLSRADAERLWHELGETLQEAE